MMFGRAALALLILLAACYNATACTKYVDPDCDDTGTTNDSAEPPSLNSPGESGSYFGEAVPGPDASDGYEYAAPPPPEPDLPAAISPAPSIVRPDAGVGGWIGGVPTQPNTAGSIDLIPVRQFLRAADIPPDGIGAYGVVVFHSKATAANRTKLLMVCHSFMAYFPKTELVPATIPNSDRMITIWPVIDPESDQAKADDCDFAVDHYDLFASEEAMKFAHRQKANFDGEGPYLVGWSPADSRGRPDRLVLVVDMSAQNTQGAIDRQFLFWKNKIVQDPQLWRSGFSAEGLRVAIKDFADQYGKDLLDAIKVFGG
jgi:hypothetical protein